MCKLNEKVNENVSEEELKGIILERIGEFARCGWVWKGRQ